MDTILLNYNSREIILELLRNRGFQTQDYENFSKNEIDTMTKNDTLDMLLVHEGGDQKAYVKYLDNLTGPNIMTIVDDLFENPDVSEEDRHHMKAGRDIVVVIVRDEPNDKMRDLCVNLFEKRGIYLAIFNVRRLQYNVLKHELQPSRVDILTPKELEEVMQKYNVRNMAQFPEISRFDPLAMAVFMRPGQVCLLTRKSPTAMSAPYYRVCV